MLVPQPRLGIPPEVPSSVATPIINPSLNTLKKGDDLGLGLPSQIPLSGEGACVNIILLFYFHAPPYTHRFLPQHS